MKHARRSSERGPFTPDQIRPGDRYELSHGHPVICEPSGREGAQKTAFGAEVIETDPDVVSAGIDAGFAFEGHTLCAPDVAVGAITDEPGWVKDQAPLLALEYAGSGQDQDEDALNEKIGDLLERGTQQIWVVRLSGARRVEVHRPGQPVEIRRPGELLAAEGVLRNPVPVDALIDRDAAHAHTLRNLLQRRGYSGIEEVRAKGREEGREEGQALGRVMALREALASIVRSRGLHLSRAQETQIAQCTDEQRLSVWIERAVSAAQATAIFTPPAS